jgi:outer membrane protein OmpA-like peptidoglycan-associated protein
MTFRTTYEHLNASNPGLRNCLPFSPGASRAIKALLLVLAVSACSRQPVAGPDKAFSSSAVGALEGAGAGAVMGFQMSAATGPGAAIGAGFGAAAGMIHGVVKDQFEETEIETAAKLREATRRTRAQNTLADHYKRRMALHPARDIYPADLFFSGDSAKMCPRGVGMIQEIARLNEYRLPYSRLVVAAYAKSTGTADASYVQHLTDRRSREFVNQLIQAGVEPRRLETRSVIMEGPLVLDPKDDPTRYNQAIEIIAIDR